MFWWKPWEPLMEARPKSGDEAVADLIADEIVEMLEEFPPAEDRIDWTDPRREERLRGRLHELPRLDAAFVGMLVRILKLDLDHEPEQIDWLLRNDHHKDACPSALHVEALLLLWPALLEHLYARKDDARGILKRAHLVGICDRVDEKFRRRRLRIA